MHKEIFSQNESWLNFIWKNNPFLANFNETNKGVPMKQLVKVEEVPGEGLVGLLGENVILFCMNYIYAGKLIGVNDTFVKLENAHIVYATGSFTDKKFSDAQKVGDEYYVQRPSIESFGKTSQL